MTRTGMHRRDAGSDEPHLELRRNMNSKWIWVLLTADQHIVNRSDADFVTKQECAANAGLNGFCLPAGT